MVTPDSYDEVRAAAALLAIAASGRGNGLRAVVLGADPDTDRRAGIARVLAAWLAQVLTETGTSPREHALQVIADSIAQEVTEAAEGTP